MKRLLFLIIVLALVAGCGGRTMEGYYSGAQLFAQGDAFMDSGVYDEAAIRYEEAIMRSTNPAQARLAQYKLSTAYFLDKSYLDAIASYEIFMDLYSDDQNMPLMLYRLAVSYYHESNIPSRDQTFTNQSILYFEQLKNQYPSYYDEYDAATPHAEMVEKLAESAFVVAKYYNRINVYDSAIKRYLDIINGYPNYSKLEECYEGLIELSIKKGAEQALIESYKDEFYKRFPDNEQAREWNL